MRTVLSGSFRFKNPALVHPRIRLYTDRLELSGWQLSGRYLRRLVHHQILQADAPTEETLLLWLADGEMIRLEVTDALRWRDAIGGFLIGGVIRRLGDPARHYNPL